jgi:hypothetical protein
MRRRITRSYIFQGIDIKHKYNERRVYLLSVFCDLMTLGCGKIAAAFGLRVSGETFCVLFRLHIYALSVRVCLFIFHIHHSYAREEDVCVSPRWSLGRGYEAKSVRWMLFMRSWHRMNSLICV